MSDICIGNVKIEKLCALSPMASVADRAYRLMCKEYGSSLLTSEMVSAKGLCYSDRKTKELCEITDAERPYAIQLFGEEAEYIAKAVKIVSQFEPDIIDINMGCPVPKVVNPGGGSALMKTPALACDIVKAATDAASCPVTVKIRAGWDEDNINAVHMATLLEKAGAAAITVHGRTRRQMYAPPVNLDIIRQVKQAVGVPVIGNGDIVDALSAENMFKATGCDFIMVGRGALGAPWLFKQINEFFDNGIILPEPPIEKRMAVMLRHIKQLCENKGDYVGMREARKHAAWYIKGIRGAAALRQEIGSLENLSQLEAIAEKVIAASNNSI